LTANPDLAFGLDLPDLKCKTSAVGHEIGKTDPAVSAGDAKEGEPMKQILIGLGAVLLMLGAQGCGSLADKASGPQENGNGYTALDNAVRQAIVTQVTQSGDSMSGSMHQYGSDEDSKAPYTIVKVFFGTNRKPLDSPTNNIEFGTERQSKLTLGEAWVTIPRDHRMGKMESPHWYKLEFSEDIAKDVVLARAVLFTKKDFVNRINNALDRTSTKEALVFIHGYNVNFPDAIKETGQLTYDLGFHGVALAYSWPSQGKLIEHWAYTADENNAQWSASHLEEFLKILATNLKAERIHLVAHSMGNRVMLEALKNLKDKGLYDDIIMAAPDIDADFFKADCIPYVVGTNVQVTLYASSNDKAMKIAKTLNGHYLRAGEAGESIVVYPGMDSVDASLVDTDLVGHSYVAENRSVISDIFPIVHNRAKASERNLRPEGAEANRYWVIPQ